MPVLGDLAIASAGRTSPCPVAGGWASDAETDRNEPCTRLCASYFTRGLGWPSLWSIKPQELSCGVAVLAGGIATFTWCVITGSSALQGGVALVDGGVGLFVHTTIISSSAERGGVFKITSSGTVIIDSSDLVDSKAIFGVDGIGDQLGGVAPISLVESGDLPLTSPDLPPNSH